MTALSAKQRAVVQEAHSWLRTPWHHEARVKGVGVDCAQFLIAVYASAGLIESFDSEPYPADWHLHRDQPRFVEKLLAYADPVEVPQPGDVAMFQYGRHAAHGSIVVEGGMVIHAWRDWGGVVLTELKGSPLQARLAGFYRLRGMD